MIFWSSSRREFGYLVRDELKLRAVQECGENVRQLICCLDVRYDDLVRCNQLAQKMVSRTNVYGP